ncbi:MAG: carboxypeptidase-like regulatory domain-containing protein [bacterium]
MTYLKTLAIAFTICAALAGFAGRAGAQSQLTLGGRVVLQTRGTLPRFTVRLYPSRETKRPMLVTYTDAAGNFKFTALEPGRYLLEVYRGESLAYQKVLTLDKNQPPQSLVITLKTR